MCLQLASCVFLDWKQHLGSIELSSVCLCAYIAVHAPRSCVVALPLCDTTSSLVEVEGQATACHWGSHLRLLHGLDTGSGLLTFASRVRASCAGQQFWVQHRAAL
jgi:hypothetical protein